MKKKKKNGEKLVETHFYSYSMVDFKYNFCLKIYESEKMLITQSNKKKEKSSQAKKKRCIVFSNWFGPFTGGLTEMQFTAFDT